MRTRDAGRTERRSRVSRQADQGCDGNLKRRGNVTAIKKHVFNDSRNRDIAEDLNAPKGERKRAKHTITASFIREKRVFKRIGT